MRKIVKFYTQSEVPESAIFMATVVRKNGRSDEVEHYFLVDENPQGDRLKPVSPSAIPGTPIY